MKHIILVAINKALGLFNLRISRKPNGSADKSYIAGMESSIARKFFWVSVYFETKSLEGSIAEFGVAAGTGLAFWLNLKRQFSDGCELWAFDSFQGFPAGTPEKDAGWFLDRGKPIYGQFTVQYVKQFLKIAGHSDQEIDEKVVFVPGFIPESLRNLELKQIKLANLDLDLYQSTLDALNFVWPRMVENGIVIFDEYDVGSDLEKWPGSKIAVDEFCEAHNLVLNRHFTGRVYLVK